MHIDYIYYLIRDSTSPNYPGNAVDCSSLEYFWRLNTELYIRVIHALEMVSTVSLVCENRATIVFVSLLPWKRNGLLLSITLLAAE
jgi:hypothetical protein